MIVSVTESYSREFHANLLLAIEASQSGLSTLLLDQALLSELIDELPNGGICHFKSIDGASSRVRLRQRLLEKHWKLTAQDQEHGILGSTFEQFGNSRIKETNLSDFDAVFAWGNFDADWLWKKFPHASERILKVGSPRLDLSKVEFEKAFGPVTENSGDYILISCSFNINNRVPYWESLTNLRKLGEYPDISENPKLYYSHLEILGEEFSDLRQTIELVLYLRDKFPGVAVIVRPHPTEDPIALESVFRGVDGVVVSSEGPIYPWIHRARAVIHRGSTTALNAVVSGKVPILYPPLRTARHPLAFAALLSQTPQTMHEAIDAIHISMTGGDQELLRKKQNFLRERVELSEAGSAKLMIDEWVKLAPHGGWPELSSSQIRRIRKASIKKCRQMEIQQQAPPRNGLIAGGRLKFPPLTETDVRQSVERISKVLGIQVPCTLFLSERSVLVQP
jgi:surface carbohydrate biosynthesis protein